MRKTAKSNRAPLAPLHNNSLRGDSPRKTAKGGGRQSVRSFGHKATHKLHNAEVPKADKANANLPDRAHDAGSKAARTQSPAKARKSVPLVTTSAVPARSKTLAKIKQGLKKPAEAPSAKQTAASVPSAVSQLDDLLIRHRAAQQSAAPQSAKPSAVVPSNVDQAGAATCTTAPLQTDSSTPSSVLRHWHVPAAPPSINALLGPSETSAASISTGRDVQNCLTQATAASEVRGVGTPQDFSDVFDLDEVSLDAHCSAACTLTCIYHRDLTYAYYAIALHASHQTLGKSGYLCSAQYHSKAPGSGVCHAFACMADFAVRQYSQLSSGLNSIS